MCKKSKKANNIAFTACPPFPKQPWIYISDPTDDNTHADKLQSMIDTVRLQYIDDDDIYRGSGVTPIDTLLTGLDKLKDDSVAKKAVMIVHRVNYLDGNSGEKTDLARAVREHAAKSGRTFVSVNLYTNEGTKHCDLKKWGPKHLELSVADLTVNQVADKVYKWLFTVIPPTEHIHLYTQAKLQVTDKRQYPDYEYCPLGEIKNRPKDAKIQFGVVITSKPVVVPNTQRLHWTVADKTGTGNFYFQYRGASSQYTWDWVQALQPGDIKSLPRMACIQIRERRRVRAAKLPLRTAAFAITSVGLVIKGVGHGLVKVGDVMTMGKSSEFVPSGDVDSKTGRKIHWGKMFEKEAERRMNKVEKARKGFMEKRDAKLAREKKADGYATDADTDCDERTLRGSDCEKDRLSEKEFV